MHKACIIITCYKFLCTLGGFNTVSYTHLYHSFGAVRAVKPYGADAAIQIEYHGSRMIRPYSPLRSFAALSQAAVLPHLSLIHI